MKNDIDKEFYLTRGQYAQKINKSKGAVIQAMRRGGLKDEYIVRDGKYYFRDYHVGLRANQESKYVPMYTPKKKYNRGNHDNANYPNAAFKLRTLLFFFLILTTQIRLHLFTRFRSNSFKI